MRHVHASVHGKDKHTRQPDTWGKEINFLKKEEKKKRKKSNVSCSCRGTAQKKKWSLKSMYLLK